MQHTSTLQTSRTHETCVIRLLGKGTYTQSECFHRVVEQTLQDDVVRIVVDLEECHYLDSTFLGCLVRLCRSHNRGAQRFVVAASHARQELLFASSQLHRFLPLTDEQPRVEQEWVDVEIESTSAKTIGKHVMQCHRVMGDLDVPDRDKFTQIADNLDEELSADEAATERGDPARDT